MWHFKKQSIHGCKQAFHFKKCLVSVFFLFLELYSMGTYLIPIGYHKNFLKNKTYVNFLLSIIGSGNEIIGTQTSFSTNFGGKLRFFSSLSFFLSACIAATYFFTVSYLYKYYNYS